MRVAALFTLSITTAGAFTPGTTPRGWVPSAGAISQPRPLVAPLFMDLMSLVKEEEDTGRSRDEVNEEALGKLVFSSTDPALDIAKDLVTYDDDFCEWLNERADKCTDLEERVGLRSLVDLVEEVTAKVVEKAKLEFAEEERLKAEAEAKGEEFVPSKPSAEAKAVAAVEEAKKGPKVVDVDVAAPGSAGGDANVFDAMKEVQMGGQSEEDDAATIARKEEEAKKEAEAAAKARVTYMKQLKTLEDMDEEKLAPWVEEEFARCDYKFLQVVNEERMAAAQAGESEREARLMLVINTVNQRSSVLIEQATERLRQVMSAPDPMMMELSISKLVAQGGADETFQLLLEANRDQAAAAGATGPAQLMDRLLKKTKTEIQRSKSPGQALISQLISEGDRLKRIELLTEAFTPVESLILASEDDKNKEPEPVVKPPDFIEIAKAMIRNFGNVKLGDGTGLKDRVMEIVGEAEQVSTDIYGESMTAEEQQDRMWNDGTISVFDLETLEQQAEAMGETMPWHGEMDESKFIEGFNKQGIKNIGG